MQSGNAIERFAIERQKVRLRVLDHLGAMLDRSKDAICFGKCRRVLDFDLPAHLKSFQGVKRRRGTDRGVATAVHHLLDLGEELDFANSAPAPLEIVSGSQARTLREMIADTR